MSDPLATLAASLKKRGNGGSMEREKMLDVALTQIERQFGKGAVMRLGEDVVDQRRLTRGLGAEDLHDATTGDAADAQREVERQRTGGDRIHADLRALVAHAHDGALAELALDLRQRALQGGVTGLAGPRVMGAHVGELLENLVSMDRAL